MSKITLIEHSPALVRAIHEVFRNSEACHCHGDGKLSEKEVLSALVRQRHVTAADAQQQYVLPVREMFHRLRESPWLVLERAGVRHLQDLQSWTYTNLLELDRIGPTTATAIEAEMSKHGLALKDGDPSRYRQLLEDEQKSERRMADLPPDEIREHCANGLMSAGQQLLRHSAVFIRYGARSSRRVRVGRPLKKTIKAGINAIQEIENIAYLLHDLEQREAVSRPLSKPGSRIPAEARQQGNVITGAFMPPVDPPDPWAHGRAI